MQSRKRLLMFGLATALAVGSSGCVIGGGGARGDVTFLWTFNGMGCGFVPDVAEVRIQIPGESLANAGRFPCATNGTGGITLLNFQPRTYSFAMQAVNAAGSILYEASGTFRVDGDVVVNVNLLPNPAAPGSAFVTYSFPPGTTVTCASLAAVRIAVDNDPVGQEFPCSAGATSPGIQITNLTPGAHTIDITLRDSNGFFYYRNRVATLTILAGQASSQQYQLDWIVGSLPLKWTFTNGASTLSCGQVGAAVLRITLRDSQGQDITYDNVPCLANGIQGTRFPYLYAGNYQLFLQAQGAGAILYTSNFNVPPTRTVVAGNFPDIDNPTATEIILLAP